MLYYLTVLVYTKSTIHLSVGGSWWISTTSSTEYSFSDWSTTNKQMDYRVQERECISWFIGTNDENSFFLSHTGQNYRMLIGRDGGHFSLITRALLVIKRP